MHKHPLVFKTRATSSSDVTFPRAETRNRTPNQPITSRQLFRLSYFGVVAGIGFEPMASSL